MTTEELKRRQAGFRPPLPGTIGSQTPDPADQSYLP